MVGSILFVALAIVAQTGEVAARAAGLSELKVVVSTPVYQPNGAVSADTTILPNAGPSVVHVYARRSLCDTAAAGASEPADAGFGWRLTSHTVRVTDTEIVMSIDWKRVWDRGQRLANPPSAAVQLTLHPGDRIPLDLISNALPTDACHAVGLGLEVQVARTASPGASGSALLPLGAVEGGAKPLDADLWLVHTMPTGTQQALHQGVKLPADGSAFSFVPVGLSTPQGALNVEITGSFRRFRSPNGAEYLLVSMARVISGSGVPAGGVTGGSATIIPMPNPTEVVSFEIPAPTQAVSARQGGSARGGGGGGAGAGAGPVPRVIQPPPAGAGGVAGGPRSGGRGGGSSSALNDFANHVFSLRLRVTTAETIK
jgi:hypothetical protein